MTDTPAPGVWWLPGKAGAPPVIGGHRGCGENLLGPFSPPGRTQPEFRENTVASFQAASQQGAAFVEFDVQVTSDGVPVLWHDDFILARSPDGSGVVSRKVAEVSVEEFKASHGQGLLRRQRPPGDYSAPEQLLEWKADTEDGLATLDEAFEQVPPEAGFDIEVKMAVPHDLARTPDEEIERMVGPILATVGRHTDNAIRRGGAPRALAYTSFDPDVCVALRQRLPPHIPVLFLTVGLPYPHPDPRRTSLESALRFAIDHQLNGIVPMGSTLVGRHDILEQAAAHGLAVATWGRKNNEVEFTKEQQALGVGAVIVDDVMNIVKGMA